MKREKVMEFVGMDLADGEKMKTVLEDGYKYLGVLEMDDVLNDEMNVQLKGEYTRRRKNVLKSKLRGKSTWDGYQHLGSVSHVQWGWNNQLDQR